MREAYSEENTSQDSTHTYIIQEFEPALLSASFIQFHSGEEALEESDSKTFPELIPQAIEVNTASFSTSTGYPLVAAALQDSTLFLSCACAASTKKLCGHQAQLLFTLLNRWEIRVFFDEKLRHEKIRQFAVQWGLESVSRLDDYFRIEYSNRSYTIRPRLKELFPVGRLGSSEIQTPLLPLDALPSLLQGKGLPSMIVVLRQHRFYNHLFLELFEAYRTSEGKAKNPLNPLAPLDLIWKSHQQDEIKFYTAISKFQNQYSTDKSASDIEALKALVKNPLGLSFYYHDARVSVNTTASALVPVQLKSSSPELRLYVRQKEDFYEVTGQLLIEDKAWELHGLRFRYHYFVLISGTLYLLDNLAYLSVIDFFRQYNYTLLVHRSKFEEFRKGILNSLEHKVRIHYTYHKPASPEQLVESGFEYKLEQLIYLSESDHYVLITPVMRYGEVEIPVLSKKQLYATNTKGDPFTIARDEAAELEFVAHLLLQHPDFKEQAMLHDYFYLHKDRFLDENWFLEAFEAWQNSNITILGFNQLSKNKLNLHKGRLSISLNSGVDWFDTTIDMRFGNQKVSLKHLHKALQNKSRFVQLGDGTQGILPQEWIGKLVAFFEAGEIVGESLHTPKIHFASIREMYEEEVLSAEVKQELAHLQEKIENFDEIAELAPPKALKAELRTYQQQGLQWLSFLDEFGFGGCLADDMGLGKTIQILAFILSQREKREHNTNLVVVPTTLIFNWQAETQKFAPDLKILTLYGPNRPKSTAGFEQYELILTAYGTLLSDIRFLKKYRFNYIVLDESQAIKNPESQRYKAARLLQSRNKVVLTGTPFENNTFDIYGQLSFACPGLLGTKQAFKEQYSSPIDKFKSSKRALDLQKKISPFILRRTKQQVASELPEKTEMLIYCEMVPEQRRVYKAYASEYRDFLLQKEGGDLDRNSLHVLQGMTKLRQICNSPALLPDQQFYSSASAKIDILMEQIEQKASHHKILIFSQFVGMLELIRKELTNRNISYEYLTGKSRNRKDKVEAFQQNSNVRVFLISLKAGGTGLNLTEADYVYLVDPWWNPAVENQAIDRAHRIGQKKNVVAVRLICPDTIEEKIIKLQETKTALAGDLIKSDGAMLKSLTKEELLDLFS